MARSRSRSRRGLSGLTVWLMALGCSPVPDTTPREQSPLANTVWILAELDGDSVALPPSMRLVDLSFRPGDRLTGFTGCNVLSGGYEATATRLDFREPLSTTRRLCPTPETTTQEQALLDALRRTTRYEYAGSWLNLYAEDQLLARFAPASAAP